jgi:2-amino-4-hydroxy-6-hydroxymethyldihydropteridine diphosphokinase
MARAFLGVGSNIRPEESIGGALESLGRVSAITLTGISTFYRTAALPDPRSSPDEAGRRDPDFLNGVLEISTSLTPEELESVLARVEIELGRERTGNKWAPRVMDLDLLVFLHEESEEDATPWPTHPDVLSRGFVAFPLLELAFELVLPGHDQPLQEVVALLEGPGGIPDVRLTARLRNLFL